MSRSREYPDRPFVGVGAVVLADGGVVLIRRRFEPMAGRWSIPGGAIEAGETLTDGLAREVLEETGLAVTVGPVIEVFDRITRDRDQRVQYHYVLVDYLCRAQGGTLQAGDDVDAAVVVDPGALGPYDLTGKTMAIITKGLAMSAAGDW